MMLSRVVNALYTRLRPEGSHFLPLNLPREVTGHLADFFGTGRT